MPPVEVRDLSKRFGRVNAVTNLTFDIEAGRVTGFLGPNGAGKSTTLRALLGLVRPTAGTATFGGLRYEELERPSTKVGAMVESPTFYPYLSGRDNLRYFQAIKRRGSPADIDRLLELVDLDARAKSKFSTYSMGMKQRLGIACALLGDPELLFLDEPTNGLDPAGVVEVRELIRQLGRGERTVILSSHLLAETELVCDNVAVLSKGKLIAQGSITELLRSHDTVRLRSTDDATATQILREISWVEGVRADDGYLLVDADMERSWEISRALAQRGVHVRELTPLHRSLEEYFMEITETDPTTGRAKS